MKITENDRFLILHQHQNYAWLIPLLFFGAIGYIYAAGRIEGFYELNWLSYIFLLGVPFIFLFLHGDWITTIDKSIRKLTIEYKGIFFPKETEYMFSQIKELKLSQMGSRSKSYTIYLVLQDGKWNILGAAKASQKAEFVRFGKRAAEIINVRWTLK